MGEPAVQLVNGATQAAALLDPLRLKLLERLAEPGSASSLARAMAIPRQKVNYHLRALQKAGFVEQVGKRKKGNCIERIVRATARSYLISPEALGSLGADPDRVADRFSSSYMVALAARTIRDVAVLQQRADKAGQPLATFNLQADIRFATPADRTAFTEELANEVARLTAKYHNDNDPNGRLFRFVIGAYPAITKNEDEGDKPSASIKLE